MPRLPKSETGCRPGQLDGEWAIDPVRFEALAALVAAEVERQGLAALAKSSKEAEADAPDPLVFDAESGIARVNLSGPLTKYPTSVSALTGGTAMLPLARDVRKAAADPRVKGMWVDVDSPGGTVLGTPELYAAFRAFGDAGRPLRFHVSGLGTSGAYWLALAGDRITADPAATVGSVGAVSRLVDTSENLRRQGVAVHYVTSGDRKSIGMPGKPVTDDDRAEVQRHLDDLVKPFHAALAERRPGLTAKVATDVRRAGVYEATTATGIGLIDGVAFGDEAFAAFAQSVKDGTAGQPRGRAGGAPNPDNPPAAGNDELRMTPEQVALAKKVPGLEQATAETSLDQVLAVAGQNATAATATVADLTNKLADARAKIPAPANPDVLAERHLRVAQQVDALATVLGPAAVTALKPALIGTAEKPDALMLAKADGAPDCRAAVLAKALAEAKPVPPTGASGVAEVLNRPTPPGANGDTAAAMTEGRGEGKAYQDELLAQRGLK